MDVRCRSNATSAKSEVRRAMSKFNITRKKKKRQDERKREYKI